MTPEDFDKLAESLADKILTAAGSGLRHYMPYTKDGIMLEARIGLQYAYRKGFNYGLNTQPEQPK